MTLRILITGSRHGWEHDDLFAALLDAKLELGDRPVLVHGAAPGVDLQAARIWKDWGMPTEPHPADWKTLGHAAGPIRNARMVDLGADLCLAFVAPGSKGTVGCIELAKQARIPIKVYEKYGPQHPEVWRPS